VCAGVIIIDTRRRNLVLPQEVLCFMREIRLGDVLVGMVLCTNTKLGDIVYVERVFSPAPHCPHHERDSGKRTTTELTDEAVLLPLSFAYRACTVPPDTRDECACRGGKILHTRKTFHKDPKKLLQIWVVCKKKSPRRRLATTLSLKQA
jgi:hypothetical protein